MKKLLEKFALSLYNKHGITPDALTYARMFVAPWLALLVSEIISGKNTTLAVITVILYLLTAVTDVLDGILARAISREKFHDHSTGGMFDRISDKILIIFLLIPFGLNLFTFLIILAESLLAFQAINSKGAKRQATRAGKVKMFLQTFLVPVLIFGMALDLIPNIFVYPYIIATILATLISVCSHYSSDD